jgi:hypothetical protein
MCDGVLVLKDPKLSDISHGEWSVGVVAVDGLL